MPVRPATHKPLGPPTRRHTVKGELDRWGGRGRGGATWMRLRARVLKRDLYCCQPCARNGMQSAADEVDHIVPLSHGGSNKMANLQSICKGCHKLKTAREGRQRAPPRGD